MTTKIRRLIWTWRCARVLRCKAALSRKDAWEVDASCHEQFSAEGFSPSDAAWEEMSYWSE